MLPLGPALFLLLLATKLSPLDNTQANERKLTLISTALELYTYRNLMSEKQVDISALTAYQMLRGITQLVTLRWTQATVLSVNGEDVRIGSRIPRFRICTVEFDFPQADERQKKEIFRRAVFQRALVYTGSRQRPLWYPIQSLFRDDFHQESGS